jgi:integrase
MSAIFPRAPRYCRQKESHRPDRAYVKIDGKRTLLGTHGSPESYKKYAQLINGELKPDKPAEAVTAPATPTVSMLMVGYLAYAARKYGGERAMEVVHCKGAFRILRRTHGDMLAKDFGPKAYQQMRLAMIEDDWSRSYIRDQCQRIKRLIAWGVAEEILPRDARHALDAVPGLAVGEFGVRETDDVLPVPDDVVALTLQHLNPAVADLVRVQRLTGMRPGEAVQLSSATIDRTNSVWTFKPPKHKTQKRGKHRLIALGPKAQAILAKYLFGDRCFRYSSASYRRAVHRACDRAFPAPDDIASNPRKLAAWQHDHRWSPNQLRHTAATAIRQEFSLEHAQVTLGHSGANVTQIYALADQAKAVEVALRIG